MKRPSSFNGLLVMASLIMAQMGVSVESHPLQRRLDHWASPMTESEDHARPSRSTRDINDNLVRNLILETFHTVFSRRFPIWFPPHTLADVRIVQDLRWAICSRWRWFSLVEWDHFVTGELLDEEVEMISNQFVFG
jgi:hypothetical protein